MSCRRISRKNKRAYTLVEVLMGVFILSVGIVSILGAFPLGMRIVYRIKRTTMLCTFAAAKAAELRAYANPMGTLCYGETAGVTQAGVEVNPFVDITPDPVHDVAGVEGDRDIYGIKGTHSKVPGTGTNSTLRMHGGGKDLHWKVSDFDVYIRSANYSKRDTGGDVFSGISIHTPDEPGAGKSQYYGRILDSRYGMGLTQNERRHAEAYGFTRRYIIEVFESPQNIAKTDKEYNPAIHKYNAYYVFSTGVWNPHVFHSTEWSPVIQNNSHFTWTDVVGEGMDPVDGNMYKNRIAHDYFWKWGNELEGWGFNKSKTIRYFRDEGTDDEADLVPPFIDKKLDPGSGTFPWQ